jgi:glycolate oxidase iron-sulfur subunit
MDSPRGRILLMKQVLEGTLAPAAAQPHVDRCLGCLACEPACPSGVQYRDLISPFRAMAERRGVTRSPGDRLRRWVAGATIPFPGRFRLALTGAKLGRALGPLVPAVLRPMLELAPEHLLAGCAQQVLDPDINVATIEVLARNGVEVVVPEQQGCCGGLAWHTGDLPAAQGFARRNLDAFPANLDAILTNAAGCGSALHEYDLILAGTADESRAAAFRKRTKDVSAFLAGLGLSEIPSGNGGARRIAYHDACHLANAQGVREQPRTLLKMIPGVTLCELADPHLCCGSAGTYNLDQPETAASLGAQKARAVVSTGADVVASGNIGCLTQLRAHLQKIGSPVRVRHTMQVMRDAYRQGERP